jgi:hypothetical protein
MLTQRLTPRQSIVYFAKVLVVLFAIVAALFIGAVWALRPYLDSQAVLIDGPPVYSFRFVQPHWLSNADTWPVAESIVRAAVLGHVPLVFAVWWVRRRLGTRPNHALQRTRRERRGCNRGVPCAGSLSLGR